MAVDESAERPKTLINPPLAFFLSLVAGYVVRLYQGGRLPAPRALAEGVGGLIILIGLGVAMAAVARFSEGGETLRPNTPSHQLFTTGVYRFTRNPIYLGMVLFSAGFGIATSNVWMLLTTALLGLALNYLVIKPEEDYLAARFGAEYADYRRKVRRWI